MPRYKLVVMSRPNEGREAEYNDWYQNFHLQQMVALPGFVSAQRFRFSRSLGERNTFPYLAIYEIDTDDIDAVVRVIEQSSGTDALVVSDVIDTASAYAAIYEACGEVVTG
jgi:hypothetical protein